MINKKTILALGSLAFVGTMSAEFVTIYDFEDGDISAFTQEFNNAVDATQVGTVTVEADPFGGSQGMVLAINPGVAGATTHNVITGFEIPAASQIEYPAGGVGKATYYIQAALPLVGGNPGVADVAFGLGGNSVDDQGNVVEIGPVYAYSNYSAYTRISASTMFDYRNGGDGFVPFQADTTIDTNVFYSIWLVVDHALNTYDVYVQGGTTFPTQTMVGTGAAYRNETFENLSKIFFMSSAGNTTDGVKGKDTMYFDNIFIDPTSENLTVPGTTVTPMEEAGQLINISTRGKVGDGNAVMIGGFAIEGTEAMTVLIQGVGPELEGQGGLAAADVLADPAIQLVGDGVSEINDDWEGAANAADIAQAQIDAGAFGLGAGSKSSAILVTLNPGIYTVLVAGNGGEGVALVEVYHVSE